MDSTISLICTLRSIEDGIRKTVDLLLNELEAGKENGINETRSRHRNAEPSVHVCLIELDAWYFDWLAFGLGEAVALVVRFGGIDGINLCTVRDAALEGRRRREGGA